jgi:hypothetical protein
MYYKYKVKSPAIAQILTSLVNHKKKELNNTYCQEQENDYIGPRTIFYYGVEVFGEKEGLKNVIGNHFGFACPKSDIDFIGKRVTLEEMIKNILT